MKFEHVQYYQEYAVVYKADQVGKAPVVVVRVFLAGMVELIVRRQMIAEAILAVAPGKRCWVALVATEHGTQYVVDFVLSAEFPEEAA